MKFLLLPVLVVFFAAAQVFCEENDPKEETDYWTSSNQIQVLSIENVYLALYLNLIEKI